MAGHTTEDAIQAVARALSCGINEVACRSDLVADGFKPAKAATIVRWALRMNQFGRRANPFPRKNNNLKKKEAP
jgi:hypothetical protein